MEISLDKTFSRPIYTPMEIREARDKLWRAGQLWWKLDSCQIQLYNFYKNNKTGTTVFNASRRLGKSFVLLTIALEYALTHPNAIIKYIQPEKGMITTNLNPDIEVMLQDCPIDIRPEFKVAGSMWLFPNGSRIQIAGTDNKNYNKIRGGSAHICIVDEAGFCSDLTHIISSILIPTMTKTKGNLILSSTTPTEPDHEFNEIMEYHEMKGSLIRKTLLDSLEDNKNDPNAQVTQEIVNDVISKLPGGTTSDAWKTEYMCQRARTDAAVLPEFTDEVQERTITNWVRPEFCDKYVAMDVGFKDMTVALFAYWDYDNMKLIIEDEYVQQKGTTKKLAEGISKKEKELWEHPLTGEQEKPWRRVSDNNLQVIEDLSILYYLHFVPTEKHDKMSYIQVLRTMVEQEQIIINPKCKTLISHMKGGSWNAARTDFKRSPDGAHYDACFTEDALVLTRTGYKKINEIQIGEEVLTHNNRFKKVLAVMNKTYSGEMVSVDVDGRDLIHCTPEHNFYLGQSFRSTKDGLTGQKMIKSNEWVEAKNINKKYMAYIPDVEFSENKNITKEMAFLYGYYVAEGNVGGNGHQIEFAGHAKEINVIDILEKAVKDTYGLGKPGTSRESIRRHKKGIFNPRSAKARVYINGNKRKISITNSELRAELQLLGKSSNKHYPDFITNISKENALYSVAGYLFGDGHFSKVGVRANSISRNIIETTELLLRKLGFSPNLRYDVRKNRKNPIHLLSLDKQQTQKLLEMILSCEDLKFVFENKLIHNLHCKNNYKRPNNYRKIKKTSYLVDEIKVYNLEVEDDNSYTVNGVAVHNCAALLYLSRNIDKLHNPYPPGYRRSKLGHPSNVYNKNPDTKTGLQLLSESLKPKTSLSKKSFRNK